MFLKIHCAKCYLNEFEDFMKHNDIRVLAHTNHCEHFPTHLIARSKPLQILRSNERDVILLSSVGYITWSNISFILYISGCCEFSQRFQSPDLDTFG